jgi:hypothetical protein
MSTISNIRINSSQYPPNEVRNSPASRTADTSNREVSREQQARTAGLASRVNGTPRPTRNIRESYSTSSYSLHFEKYPQGVSRREVANVVRQSMDAINALKEDPDVDATILRTSLERLKRMGVDPKNIRSDFGKDMLDAFFYVAIGRPGNFLFPEPAGEMFNVLIENGFDRNNMLFSIIKAHDPYGQPGPRFPYYKNLFSMVLTKIAQGDLNIDINFKDSYGDTVAHKAARLCHVEILNLLRAAGANMEMRNKDGKTPADLLRDQHQSRPEDSNERRPGQRRVP